MKVKTQIKAGPGTCLGSNCDRPALAKASA